MFPFLIGLSVLLLLLVRFGYGWAMAVRGWLYDVGLLAAEAFPVPVVALGNLRVGGTGKSPHAAYVVAQLLAAGYRVGLLSRGYGRRTRGFRLVAPTDSAAAVGDEPLEQARRFASQLASAALTVAVCEDRRAGIRTLLAGAQPPAVVVLDDAYQHRAVRPSLRVLLTEFERPFSADRVLPLGRLREFARAARRAHAVVVTKCSPAETRPDLAARPWLPALRRAAGETVPVLFTTYAYGAWQPLTAAARAAARPPAPGASLVVVTAIDNPAPLYKYLLGQGYELAHQLRWPDHHAFAPADLARLHALATAGPYPVLTTGKDAVRLLDAHGSPRPEMAELAVWWLPVQVAEMPVTAEAAASSAPLAALVLDHVRTFTPPAPAGGNPHP